MAWGDSKSLGSPSIKTYFKDMGQIVTIFMQFGMWMAPIMYDESLFIDRAPIICKLIKLNPIYYIVKGYRFCMIKCTIHSSPVKHIPKNNYTVVHCHT